MLGLDENDPCDEDCIELVGIKEMALQQEIHENDDKDGDSGALAGVIIGGIVLIIALVTCICVAKFKSNKKDHALVNQSSFRSDVKV